MKYINQSIAILIAPLLLAGCHPKPKDVTDVDLQAPIYPDYTDITIPVNIAPLNFILRNDADAMAVEIVGENTQYTLYADDEASFPIDKWKAMLRDEKGKSLTVTVTTRVDGKWMRYRPFEWHVSPDSIDSYLSYRLIEPGYEVWNRVYLCERNIENFEERTLIDNYNTDRACLNCHIYGNQPGNGHNRSMLHLRGPKGGTMLIDEGCIRKLTLKADSMQSGAVYGEFHPTANCAVFSSNIILPALHSQGSQRLEVYDTVSDVFVADFDNNKLIFSPLTADADVFETFPVFSADGNSVFFCTAPKVALPDSVHSLKYSLCRIPYDAANGRWGEQVDTLWNASERGGSVCHPKVSPDGRYVMFTVADYGTFPIWHRETDLYLMDLESGEIDPMEAVRSDKSDTYHCWSSSGRWFVFASKRDDGQYGKPYFAYLSADGKAHKPFVLPQRHPSRYDNDLHSYNIPNLSPVPAGFDADDMIDAYYEVEAEKFSRTVQE